MHGGHGLEETKQVQPQALLPELRVPEEEARNPKSTV